jgi:hypothetical protein
MAPIDARRFAEERRKFDPDLCAMHGEKLDRICDKIDSLDDFIRSREDYIQMRRQYLDARAVRAHADEQAAKNTRRLSWVAMAVAIVGGALGWFSGRG